MPWTVETLDDAVDDEIANLPDDMQAAFLRLAERIEAVGLERIREPHVKHLRGKLWKCALADVTGLAALFMLQPSGNEWSLCMPL